MTNDNSDEEWDIDEDGLRIFTNKGWGEGYYDDDESTELKVEAMELKPAGCVPKVKLLRPINGNTENEDDEEGNESSRGNNHDEQKDDATNKVPRTKPVPKHKPNAPVPWDPILMECISCRQRGLGLH